MPFKCIKWKKLHGVFRFLLSYPEAFWWLGKVKKDKALYSNSMCCDVITPIYSYKIMGLNVKTLPQPKPLNLETWKFQHCLLLPCRRTIRTDFEIGLLELDVALFVLIFDPQNHFPPKNKHFPFFQIPRSTFPQSLVSPHFC